MEYDELDPPPVSSNNSIINRYVHEDTHNALKEKIREMKQAFWAWESCNLAAMDGDSEEIEAADYHWNKLKEIMKS